MDNDNSIDKLITLFQSKGGRIDKYYLRGINRGRKALVYLNGWFSGQNVREAISKAFGK